MHFKIYILVLLIFNTFIAFPQVSIEAKSAVNDNTQQEVTQKLDSAKIYAETNLEKSISCAKNALILAEKINDYDLTAETESLLGSCYTKLGMYDEALKYLLSARKLIESSKNERVKIDILKRIGDLFWYNGKFTEALEYYKIFSDYAAEINDTLNLISSFISKGAVYGNTGKLDTAIILFEKALDLSIKIKDNYREMLSKFNIADALLYSGKPYQSIAKFNEIRYEVENNIKPYHNKSGLYNSLAEAYLATKDYSLADKFNKKALIIAKKDNLLHEVLYYYGVQFKIDTAVGNYKSAFENHLKYKQLNDSLKSRQLQEYLANFNMRYDLEKGHLEIEKLKLENEIGKTELKRNRYFLISGIIVILLLLALFINIYRSKKELNIKNQKLDEQKEELESTLEKLKQTQAQLLHSEKMASLGILTTGISHEINNPLNYINGGIHILEDIRDEFDAENIEEIRENFNLALQMVEDGFNRTASIVKSLMTFATRENDQLEEHSVKSMLQNTLQFLTPKLEGITVETDCPDTDKLMVYPDKLHQVFFNIFDNAIKAVEDIDSKKIKVSTSKNNHYFRISIQNNGPKIAKKHLNKLFDPFFTTRPPGEGVGMGLTISYNLIKEHKGEIKFRNLDDGVEFTIELPLV